MYNVGTTPISVETPRSGGTSQRQENWGIRARGTDGREILELSSGSVYMAVVYLKGITKLPKRGMSVQDARLAIDEKVA